MKPEAAKNIAEYAMLQAAARLDRVAYQMGVMRKSKSPETVHELRVSIRRFMSCLKVYPQFFPAKESKKIRKRLKKVMKAAGEVRDRDIALQFGETGGPAQRQSCDRRIAPAAKASREGAHGESATVVQAQRVSEMAPQALPVLTTYGCTKTGFVVG